MSIKSTFRNASCFTSNIHSPVIYALNNASLSSSIICLYMCISRIMIVIFMCTYNQMVRIATSSIMTSMSNDTSFRNFAIQLDIYKCMSSPILFISLELAISCTCYRFIPVPTSSYFINSNIIFNEIHNKI